MTAPPAPPIDEFSGVFSAVQDGIGTVTDAVNAIIDGINSVLHLLPPGFPVDGIRSGVEDLRRIFNEKITELNGLLAYGGDPDGLRAVGSAWANDIGATTSRLAGYSTLNGVRSDDYWTGMAADAYRNTLIPQNTALTTIGDEIDSTLNDLAVAITTFWVSVLAALTTLEVGLIAAVASATSVIASPAAPGFAIASFVLFGAALVSALVAFNAIANDTANRSAELERRLSNDTAFTGGSWPRSTTPISGDGSITDGDNTDWHLE